MDKPAQEELERLRHIAEAIDQILRFCEGKSEFDFLNDPMLNCSVLYQFIVIGEAVRYLNPEILEKYPYPWHLPRSFRNYVIHEYFGINLKQVFKTVTDLLPEFRNIIQKMMENEC